MKFWEPDPVPGTLWYKFCEWFVNNINWCEGYYFRTDREKPENKLYNFFYKYWLYPFPQNDCLCCNTVRGIIRGLIIGFILGGLLL